MYTYVYVYMYICINVYMYVWNTVICIISNTSYYI